MRRMIAAAAGLLLAGPVLTTMSPAAAAPAAGACYIQAGSVTAGKDLVDKYVNATSPISVKPVDTMAKQPFAGTVALSSEWVWDDDFGDETSLTGTVVTGGVLYDGGLLTQKGTDGKVVSNQMTRIGGGWGDFRTLTKSWTADAGSNSRTYALRNDGVLYRWFVSSDNGKPVWRAAGSYAGFSAVKTVALISRTSTYDTLLATTRGGALYTIRIPLTSPMKPIVKAVRTSTWQGFETLLTTRCGQYGTLLLGIDKDTGSAYLYAVGHANGTATVINSLGKVPGTFGDPVNYSWASFVDPPLNGE
ncbi:hypothetical protein OHA18_34945 [Kribbella sp. NBC_00709]|uniref:hypothetical protein n=1 Tax=Kribbella sp. NBC_00709 TaxID=2975972 RepID=UPI002E298E6B|nr:hypothetical protein [Kribbella sp. NBC_00709]